MNMHLIVVRSFDRLARGDTFVDLAHIAQILDERVGALGGACSCRISVKRD